MFKSLSTKNVIDPKSLVNIETGEQLPEGTKVTYYVPKKSVEVNSSFYCTLDLDALKMVKDRISRTELGTLIYICVDLDSKGVIVRNNGNGEMVPHTLKTLSKAIQMSTDRLSKIIDKMKKIGIMTRTKMTHITNNRTVYVVNPTLIRRSNMFNASIKLVFPDLSIEIPHPDGGVTKKQAIQPNVDFDNS